MATTEGDKIVANKLYDLDAMMVKPADQADDAAKQAALSAAIESLAADVGVAVRTIAAQVLPKYAGRFPDVREAAVAAVMKLVGDSEANVRTATMRNLPAITKTGSGESVPENVKAVVEALLPLAVGETPDALAKAALNSLLKSDTIVVLEKVLAALGQEEDAVRQAAVDMMKKQIIPESRKGLLKDASKAEVVKAALEGALAIVDKGEFRVIVEFMKVVPYFNKGGALGPQAAADMLAEQLKGADDTELVLTCVTSALPFVRQCGEDSTFISSLTGLLATLDQVPEELAAKLLQQLTKLAPLCSEVAAQAALPAVVAQLRGCMAAEGAATLSEADVVPQPEAAEGEEEPEKMELDATGFTDLKYGQLEALLYVVHQLGLKATDSLLQAIGAVGTEHADELEPFKEAVKATFEAAEAMDRHCTGAQAASNKLKGESRKMGGQLRTALAALKNIQKMCRGLLILTPAPTLIKDVTLSFTPAPKAAPKRNNNNGGNNNNSNNNKPGQKKRPAQAAAQGTPNAKRRRGGGGGGGGGARGQAQGTTAAASKYTPGKKGRPQGAYQPPAARK